VRKVADDFYELSVSRQTDKLIAVVEDDPDLADLFRDSMKDQAHWRLLFFPDGQIAKNTLPELQPDLILLDVGLPNLDGGSLYKILRGHSRTRHTPIIVITGSHDWELRRMGLQTGLFLRKPFKLQELLFIMHALLGEDVDGSG
jgi:DNA-binding response OmpR family regulator